MKKSTRENVVQSELFQEMNEERGFNDTSSDIKSKSLLKIKTYNI